MVWFYSKFFWYKFGAKEYFWWNFRPIGRNFGQKSTSEIPKFEEILKKKKNSIFFFRMWFQMSHDVSKKKKSFSRLFSPYKAPKKFLLKLVNFSCQNFSSKTLRIFDFRKKHKNFHFFFTSWKMRENVKKQKLQKKNKYIFFRKKIFFWFFWNSHFFMENRQTGPKNWHKMLETCVYVILIIFGEK